MDACFVDPVTFSFDNPVTKKKKTLHVHVNYRYPKG